MPALTVNTSPTNSSRPDGHSPTSTSKSQSASPERPPVSPITPTLRAARPVQTARQTYTHAQPPQIAVAAPAPEPIKFDENPDVLATKSAISILMMQARVAAQDIKSLQRTKERGLQDPDEFLRALQAGEIKQKGDTFMGLAKDDEDDDEDMDRSSEPEESKAWEKLPRPQEVVRMPHINWDQYAVVGDSLNKLHSDQLRNPPEGSPQRLGPGGQLLPSTTGLSPAGSAKDKMEKMGTRKGGKR
ncbi:hypothetical protein VTL71DRAFT_13910 [Oculimacula yallundae]|uniref:Uncharacterized protein n=1 Tax=Oculimacula yallundae TaxID=86028 RepID=A0ABR4CLR7_9HELO